MSIIYSQKCIKSQVIALSLAQNLPLVLAYLQEEIQKHP